MKDIDFDELDKAVSSLLSPGQDGSQPPAPGGQQDKKESPQQQNEKAQDTPAATASPIETVASKDDESTKDTPDAGAETQKAPEAPAKDTAEKPKPAMAAIAPRRVGRFMDVVHPEAIQKDKAAAPPSRSGNAIQPMSADIVPEAPASGSAQPSATPANSAEPVWPDPITLQNNPIAGSSDESGTDAAAPQPVEGQGLAGDAPAAKTDTTPVTPFLSDTKVEKRPLGAFSDTAAPADGADVDGDGVKDDPPKGFHATRVAVEIDDTPEEQAGQTGKDQPKPAETQQAAASTAAEAQPGDGTEQQKESPMEALPRELEKDIMAVEADTVTVKANEIHVEPTRPDTSAADAPMTADAVVSRASATSIPKQYKESDEVGTADAHSLFDTKEYHPPIAHHGDSQAHKYTIVWVIVALLLLIATAAGFGYWLYLQI